MSTSADDSSDPYKFVDANLTGACLCDADLRAADFTGARLDRLSLDGGKFDEAPRAEAYA